MTDSKMGSSTQLLARVTFVICVISSLCSATHSTTFAKFTKRKATAKNYKTIIRVSVRSKMYWKRANRLVQRCWVQQTTVDTASIVLKLNWWKGEPSGSIAGTGIKEASILLKMLIIGNERCHTRRCKLAWWYALDGQWRIQDLKFIESVEGWSKNNC